MAGAGYKLFNTGDVLTAAQVNTYLMEQTVMVFADAAARTTALSGVVSEGMISYLKDTNAVEVYNGSAWVASDDPNAIQNTIVDAKGDLISASAADTPARLAVGNNGETLVADSSATTGLRWQGSFEAGKNKIINGDFAINQRNFTSSSASGDAYTFDRWVYTSGGDGTVTYSAQTNTSGAVPDTQYQMRNFFRCVTTGQTTTSSRAALGQRIEGIETLAGQTATISFWAKAGSGTPKIAIEFLQRGDATTDTYAGQVTLSTSWARYSVSVSVPSLTGVTLTQQGFVVPFFNFSAGSDFNARTGSLGIQSNTFDIWGVQVEAGNVATAFQTATGTLAGEFAAACRYFQRLVNGADSSTERIAIAQATGSTTADAILRFPVIMRTAPTLTISAAGDFQTFAAAGTVNTATAITGSIATPRGITLGITSSNLVAGNATQFRANSASATLDFSAEL